MTSTALEMIIERWGVQYTFSTMSQLSLVLGAFLVIIGFVLGRMKKDGDACTIFGVIALLGGLFFFLIHNAYVTTLSLNH